MSGIQKLAGTGAGVIKELNTARHEHISTMRVLAAAELDLALTGAQAENRAIEAAGGEKALGVNADARRRALLIALDEDKAYQEVHARHVHLLGNVRLAQAAIDALKDTFGLLKASLYASASRE